VQPLLQWKSNKYYIFWVCICSLSYPALNEHAPYCRLWPARFHCIFPHRIKGTIFEGKKVIEHKICVSIFSATFYEQFLILRWIKRDMIEMNIGFHVKYPLFLSDFNESWIFSTEFRKNLKIKFHENLSQRNRAAADLRLRPHSHRDRQSRSNRACLVPIGTN